MGLTVYGGGGKPEEEKTVTAGTSVIEVLPSSGKVMKKVTVNPTPSQIKEVTAGTGDATVSPDSGKLLSGVTVHPTPSHTKTVTPTSKNITVSPDSGKLLSEVVVNGDSDLVAENIKQGVNIFGVDGSFDNSYGAYVWKKLTAQGGDFVDFVVSDSPTAHPDGGEQGGYWYEKVAKEKEVIAKSGGYTFSGTKNKITIPHGIGKKPNYFGITNAELYTPYESGSVYVDADATNLEVTGYHYLGDYDRSTTINWNAVYIGE